MGLEIDHVMWSFIEHCASFQTEGVIGHELRIEQQIGILDDIDIEGKVRASQQFDDQGIAYFGAEQFAPFQDLYPVGRGVNPFVGGLVDIDNRFRDGDVAPSLLGGFPIEAGQQAFRCRIIGGNLAHRLQDNGPGVATTDNHLVQAGWIGLQIDGVS